MLILSGQVEVVGSGKDKGDQGFPGIPQVDHPLQRVGVPIREVTKFPNNPPYQECQVRKTDQHGQEEV